MSEDAAVQIGQLSPDRRWRWDGTEWAPIHSTATPHPPPAWASFRVRAEASWWTFGAALLLGFVADQALRVGAYGVGTSLGLACAALTLVFVARLKRTESRVLAGAAVLFAAWLSLRASPWLFWPDLAAGLILLGSAASIANQGSLLNMGIAEAAARGLHAMLHWLGGGVWAIRPITRAISVTDHLMWICAIPHRTEFRCVRRCRRRGIG